MGTQYSNLQARMAGDAVRLLAKRKSKKVAKVIASVMSESTVAQEVQRARDGRELRYGDLVEVGGQLKVVGPSADVAPLQEPWSLPSSQIPIDSWNSKCEVCDGWADDSENNNKHGGLPWRCEVHHLVRLPL